MYAWETNEILETVAEAQKRNATKLNQTRRENRQQIIQKKNQERNDNSTRETPCNQDSKTI